MNTTSILIPPHPDLPHQGGGVSITIPELLALRIEGQLLNLAPQGKVFATRSGGHLSRFKGRGMEFDESRPYQPGDEVRNMDWRVTARAGKPHVKMFREERERPVWLLVDLGASMRFGTRIAFKSVIAAKVAALLAWAAIERGDRVGGLVFDETRYFERRPAARVRGLLPLLQALTQAPCAVPYVGFLGITAAALHLQRQVRPGGLVFVVSDFVDLHTERAAWLAQLSQACELVLINIYDPIEEYAPRSGTYPVTDGKRRSILQTANLKVRNNWQQRFSSRVHLLEDLALRYRAHVLNIATNAPLRETLARGLHPRWATT